MNQTLSQPAEQLQTQELQSRINKLYQKLKAYDDNWDYIFISSKVNQYYFTSTMQSGVLVITNAGDFYYFVRRSLERAMLECPFKDHIYPMQSYKDIVNMLPKNTRKIYIEADATTYSTLERMGKYFDVSLEQLASIDNTIQKVRAVKSSYELQCMEESGRQHKILLEDIVPSLLYVGMNEAELCAKMYEKMIALGYHGVSRFGAFQTEIMVGQMGFGENSIYPTSFDGPGGMKGMSAAVPLVGDKNRLLKVGDLVFVDVGYGYQGYHTDRTQIYSFAVPPAQKATQFHEQCLQIQKELAAKLKPGAIPSEIYADVMKDLDEDFLRGFMGATSDKVKFLGHGIGLQVDEYPVIAKGFNDPLEENMALALEPKVGIVGAGIVGVEDTYVVTPTGGKCITGGEKSILVLP